VDAAVHSLKDVPTDQPGGLVIAAVPERAAPNDLLVTGDGTDLHDLPPDAVVGTGSLRRGAQLRRRRPDLTVEPIRGNVDTRIAKLLAGDLQAEHEARVEDDRRRKAETGGDPGTLGPGEGPTDGEVDDEASDPEFEQDVDDWFDSLSELERRALEREVDVEYDALVMAEAGLDRAGLLHHVEYERLGTREFVPAPGQGALAITASDPAVVETIRSALDVPRTRVETTVERTVLNTLGGGCVAPVGVHAVLQGEYVHAEAVVLSRDGEEVVERSRDLAVERHAREARELAREMIDEGADELIEAAKREGIGTADTTADPTTGRSDTADETGRPETTDEEGGA
jgi:hydroxymethylbilane synthase